MSMGPVSGRRHVVAGGVGEVHHWRVSGGGGTSLGLAWRRCVSVGVSGGWHVRWKGVWGGVSGGWCVSGLLKWSGTSEVTSVY